MKVRLVKPARIRHNPGDIVEVSPETASFLLAVGAAVAAPEDKKPAKKTAKKE